MATNVRVEAKKLPFNASEAAREKSTSNLLKIFKRACNECGIAHELKEHEFFIRKTDKKRRKRMIKIRGSIEALENQSNDRGNNDG